MYKLFKWIGMIGGAIILLMLAAIFWYFGSIIYVVFILPNTEYYKGRFLLKMAVEVNGEIKTGESIYEVSYNRTTWQGGVGNGMGHVSDPINGIKGTMPFINLDKKGFLAATLKLDRTKKTYEKYSINKPGCNAVTPIDLPTEIMVDAKKNYKNFRAKIDEVISIDSGQRYNLPDLNIRVIHVTKREDIEYSDISRFEFCDLEKILPSVKPLYIEISKTDSELITEYPENLFWIRALRHYSKRTYNRSKNKYSRTSYKTAPEKFYAFDIEQPKLKRR